MDPSNPLLASFLSVGQELFCTISDGTTFAWVSPNWSTVMGLDPQHMLGRSWVDVIHPSDLASARVALEHLMKVGKLDALELRVRHGDGSWRWLEFTCVFEAGDILASSRDITDQKYAGRKITELRNVLDMAEDVVSVGCWRVEADTYETSWSDEVFHLFGLTPGQDEVLPVEEAIACYHPEDQEPLAQAVAAAFEDGTPINMSLRVQPPGLPMRYVQLRSTTERDTRGKITSLVGIVTDVTEHRSLKEQAALSARLNSLGTLAAGMAHEINNPLTYVEGNLEIMEDIMLDIEHPDLDKDDLMEMFSEVRDGVQRIGRIVHGLKAFARVEPPTYKRVDLREVIDSAVTLTAYQVRQVASLVVDMKPELPPVKGDATQLTQVLVNLIINAVQAIENAGESSAQEKVFLRVFTDVEHNTLVIQIQDTGPGVPAVVAQQIFDPFFSTKKSTGGTGMGLSICHGIMQAHFGDLRLASNPGEPGSIFELVLPIDNGMEISADVDLAEPTFPELAQLVGRRILVIDDEMMLGKMMVRQLSDIATVEHISSGKQAIERICRGTMYDIIVCDMFMPEMTGKAFYKRLKQIAPDMVPRVVFMTGGTLNDDLDAFAGLLNNPILYKPFDFDAVLYALASVMS